MILVDTSIWIDHLRNGSPALAAWLQNDLVCTHDFVIGELACGNQRNRAEVLGLMQSLPRLGVVTEAESIFFIEQQDLKGCGIGYIDIHLLAASITHGERLRTKDKRLKSIAEEKAWAHAVEAH